MELYAMRPNRRNDGASIELKTPDDERDGEFYSDGIEVDLA
jgi:hypothetical protein